MAKSLPLSLPLKGLGMGDLCSFTSKVPKTQGCCPNWKVGSSGWTLILKNGKAGPTKALPTPEEVPMSMPTSGMYSKCMVWVTSRAVRADASPSSQVEASRLRAGSSSWKPT